MVTNMAAERRVPTTDEVSDAGLAEAELWARLRSARLATGMTRDQ